MSITNPGGPAFPLHPDMASRLGCFSSESDAGMTLRDYFAAKAMQGLLSDPSIRATEVEFAVRAYSLADAMLKARET